MTDSTPPAFAPGKVWDSSAGYDLLQVQGLVNNKRTAMRRLHELQVLPTELAADTLRDELARPLKRLVRDWVIETERSRRRLVLFVQLHALPDGSPILHANDGRGARYWIQLEGVVDASTVAGALRLLRAHLGKDLALFPHGELVAIARSMPKVEGTSIPLLAYAPVLPRVESPGPRPRCAGHLRTLEDESIHIIREAVAESGNPVMLYSIGKDSSVMLHLARKAFYPAPPPFPLLHVDTRWKFQEMYLLRDHMAQSSGMDLLVHVNPEAIERDINPFDHGSVMHTDITKTAGLKQALDKWGFDVVFGGARRDEERSRAKERIFSFRDAHHGWDPKNQRPELWSLYNAHKREGESMRVFPLSNWTELDIWQYIHHEAIPVVPLYLAARRPVVQRGGMLLMVDDDRFRLLPGEQIEEREVRFRTLGCYPLTGAIESSASTIPEIILELAGARSSERQGRAIDTDASASMERKKREGYF